MVVFMMPDSAAQPHGAMPIDELTVDLARWSPERAHELAQGIVGKFEAAIEQPGPDFTCTFSQEEAEFLGKAMVVQIQLSKMATVR